MNRMRNTLPSFESQNPSTPPTSASIRCFKVPVEHGVDEWIFRTRPADRRGDFDIVVGLHDLCGLRNGDIWRSRRTAPKEKAYRAKEREKKTSL